MSCEGDNWVVPGANPCNDSSSTYPSGYTAGALVNVVGTSGATTIVSLSSATFTGTWLITFNVAISSTGWAHKNDSFLYWEAGDDTGLNDRIKCNVMGVNADAVPIYFGSSYIMNFGTSPNAIRVNVTFNNFNSLTLPTLNGNYYAIKLSD